MKRQLARTAWRRVAGKLVRNPPEALDRSVLLLGSGRSGTTWVTEILNAEGRYRVVFEPFFPAHNPQWPLSRPFVAAGAEAPHLHDGALAALSGTLRSKEVDAHNTVLRPTHRLVKAIRANLCLEWLARSFPEVRLVFLIRHPLAVARSRMLMGWGSGLDKLMAQPELVAHLGPLADRLASEPDPFLQQVLLWCVENRIAAEQLPQRAHALHYESLCTEPLREATRLFESLELPVPAKLGESIARPSALSRDHSAVSMGSRPVDAWVGQVESSVVEAAIDHVTAFGLGHLYSEDPFPLGQLGR